MDLKNHAHCNLFELLLQTGMQLMYHIPLRLKYEQIDALTDASVPVPIPVQVLMYLWFSRKYAEKPNIDQRSVKVVPQTVVSM